LKVGGLSLRIPIPPPMRPAGKILPFVNYALLCAGTMNLNHNVYKIINVIRNYNDKISVVCVGISSGKYSQQERCLPGWHNHSTNWQPIWCWPISTV